MPGSHYRPSAPDWERRGRGSRPQLGAAFLHAPVFLCGRYPKGERQKNTTPHHTTPSLVLGLPGFLVPGMSPLERRVTGVGVMRPWLLVVLPLWVGHERL